MTPIKFIALNMMLVAALLSACGPSQAELDATATQVAADIFATQTAQAPTATATFTPSPTFTATPTDTPTPTPTDTPLPTSTPTPGLSSLILTLDDLPAGFVSMPEAQVLAMEQAYPDGSSAFGFTDEKNAQIVMGVLFLAPSRAEQETYDALLPNFVGLMETSLGAQADADELPGLADVGETRAGSSSVGQMAAVSMRWDVGIFRRGKVLALLIVAYPDGDQPVLPFGEVARLMDERITKYLGGD